MAFCSKCGNELDERAAFCPRCGASVASRSDGSTATKICAEVGTLTFVRKPCAIGKLIKVKIKVDGQERGAVKENEELTIRLSYGVHHVEMQAGGNSKLSFPVDIGKESDDRPYAFRLSAMGKPEFLGVTPAIASEKGTYSYQPKKKAHWLIPVIVVLAILAAVAAFGSNSENKTDMGVLMASNGEKVADTPRPKPSFMPITGEAGHWEITVSDFSYEDSMSAGLLHAYQAEDGSKYCIISVTVKNTGTQADTFLPLFATTNDTTAKIKWNGYEYTRSELVWSKDNLSMETLNPLVSTSGQLAFELPDEAIESEEVPVLVFSVGKSSFDCELVKK